MVNPDTGEIGRPLIRTPHNYSMYHASVEGGVACDAAEGKTQQQFAEECDINTIVFRFGLTGTLPQDVRMPMYGDFTEAVTDYRTAVEQIMAADKAFMEFPAEVRARFQNDPQMMIDWAADAANLEEARKLGLAMPIKEPEVPSNAT